MRARLWTARLLLTPLLLLLIAAASASAETHEAKAGVPAQYIVNTVSVSGLGTIGKDEFLYLMGMVPGSSVTDETITEGITRAFRKGIFEDISVHQDDSMPGSFTLSVVEKLIAEDIDVEVEGDLTDSEVADTLRLKEDMRFNREDLEKEKVWLYEYLDRRGYPTPRVTATHSEPDREYRSDIEIKVELGTPSLVNSIVIIGRPDREVRTRLSLEEGDVYDRVGLEADLEELRKYYKARGYFNPVVGPYTYFEGQLLIGVRTGKRLNVIIKGNDALSYETILAALPFTETREVSDDVVAEALGRIQGLYHEKGYQSVQIAPVVKEAEEEITVSLYIHEGKGLKVKSLNFTGSTSMGQRINEIVSLSTGTLFSPAALEADLQKVRDLYVALGFKDATVEATRVQSTEDGMELEVEVKEGKEVRVLDITIVGNRQLGEAEALQALTVKKGAPYNEIDIIDSRRNLLTLCRSKGFYECTVEVERGLTEQGITIGFKLREGERFFFGKTIVSGNEQTDVRVFERARKYKEGDPLDPSLLLKTRQKLLALGLFSEMELETLEGKGDRVDVLIKAREVEAGSLDFGLGYGEYERARGFMELSYRNLFGMNRTGALRTEQSSLWQRYIASYTEPHFWDSDLKHRTTLTYEDRKEKNIDTAEIKYMVRKKTGATGLEKDFTQRFKGTFYYEFSLVKTFDIQPDVALSKEDTGTLAISSLLPGLYYNNTDDPIDPNKGYSLGLTMKHASRYLGSETDFVKGTVQGAVYLPVFGGLVTALSLKCGLAEGLYETNELPLVERFFLGGRNTVRGFDQDSLGPKSESGDPTGGNAFLLNNFELRLRIKQDWQVVAFLDSGNVWIANNEVSIRDMRHSWGLGLRYKTPVGPIRIDYGWKFHLEDNEAPGELHFSIGQAF